MLEPYSDAPGQKGRSPDTATAEDLRRFQLHQTQSGMQPPSINSAVSALAVLLHRDARPAGPCPAAHGRAPAAPAAGRAERGGDCASAPGGAGPEVQGGIQRRLRRRAARLRGRALKVGDIDCERMLLRVEQGKGRKTATPCCRRNCSSCCATGGRRRAPRGWLFPGRNPIEPLSTRQLNRAVHAAAEAAGITKRVSPHTLRHSFATHLLEQDVDIRVIQVLLGHAKLDTTALYTRVANTTIRNVNSPLDRLASTWRAERRPD